MRLTGTLHFVLCSIISCVCFQWHIILLQPFKNYASPFPGGNMQKQSQIPGAGAWAAGRNIAGRFPLYGTQEFSRQCNWTMSMPLQQEGQRAEAECTFLVRPQEGEQEGIALWVTQVAMGFIISRQAGCRLLFDYGTDVDIGRVISPAPAASDDQLLDWTVPPDFQCNKTHYCYTISGHEFDKVYTYPETIPGRQPFAPVPFFRFAHMHGLYHVQFTDLFRALPGFNLNTGMACSLGSLFHLPPSASYFEPLLFSELLPKLRQPNALVMAVYIRTSQTELAINATEDTNKHARIGVPFVKQALVMEAKYLSGEMQLQGGRDIRKVVWMVVSDSRHVKNWVNGTLGGKDANAELPVDRRKWPSRVIERDVLFTGSRGAHTRPGGSPLTIDFADAFIDWFLIGESDLIVNGPYTFGYTGSMRTSSPVYNLKGDRLQLVRPGKPPKDKQIRRDIKPGEIVKIFPFGKQ